MEDRACLLGKYIAETGSTVRRAAQVFAISKSTVHKDVTVKLRREDRALYARVREVLEKNKAEYSYNFANPLMAAQRGFIDDIIEPTETRRRLCEDLEILQTKCKTNPWKKHGNIPL